MEINIKINIEFGEKALKVLKKCGKNFLDTVDLNEPTEESIKENKKEDKKNIPPLEPFYKLTDNIKFDKIKKKINSLIRFKKSQEVKELLNQFNIDRISELETEKYNEFFEHLQKIMQKTKTIKNPLPVKTPIKNQNNKIKKSPAATGLNHNNIN